MAPRAGRSLPGISRAVISGGSSIAIERGKLVRTGRTSKCLGFLDADAGGYQIRVIRQSAGD